MCTMRAKAESVRSRSKIRKAEGVYSPGTRPPFVKTRPITPIRARSRTYVERESRRVNKRRGANFDSRTLLMTPDDHRSAVHGRRNCRRLRPARSHSRSLAPYPYPTPPPPPRLIARIFSVARSFRSNLRLATCARRCAVSLRSAVSFTHFCRKTLSRSRQDLLFTRAE